jgi:hypothetical protein
MQAAASKVAATRLRQAFAAVAVRERRIKVSGAPEAAKTASSRDQRRVSAPGRCVYYSLAAAGDVIRHKSFSCFGPK